MIDIVPGIFENDFNILEQKLDLVASVAPWVQFDFADGTLFPAQSFLEIEKLAGILKKYGDGSNPSFEAHLMVVQPEKFIKPLVDAGFRRLIAHIEAHDPRLFLDEARYESVEVGIAIDGPTQIEDIEPFLEEIDVVLVMLAESGANEMALQPENVEKIRQIRKNFPDLPIAVEQGINIKNAKVLIDAGATRIISDPIKALEMLKNPTALE